MLMNHSALFWAVAPKPKQSAPFLDIEEILDKKIWQDRELTLEEIRSLKDTTIFLRLVMKGMKIAEDSVEKRFVSADLVSINAFNVASRGYQRANFKTKIAVARTIEISLSTLTMILSGAEKISEEDLDITYNFIKGISAVVIY